VLVLVILVLQVKLNRNEKCCLWQMFIFVSSKMVLVLINDNNAGSWYIVDYTTTCQTLKG